MERERRAAGGGQDLDLLGEGYPGRTGNRSADRHQAAHPRRVTPRRVRGGRVPAGAQHPRGREPFGGHGDGPHLGGAAARGAEPAAADPAGRADAVSARISSDGAEQERPGRLHHHRRPGS